MVAVNKVLTGRCCGCLAPAAVRKEQIMLAGLRRKDFPERRGAGFFRAQQVQNRVPFRICGDKDDNGMWSVHTAGLRSFFAQRGHIDDELLLAIQPKRHVHGFVIISADRAHAAADALRGQMQVLTDMPGIQE